MFGSRKETQLIALLLCGVLLLACGVHQAPQVEVKHQETATLWPDIAGVTVPVNGAPLTFRIDSIEADRYHVTFRSPRKEVHIEQKDPWIVCPLGDWRALAQQAAGDSIYIDIYVKKSGRWDSYTPVSVAVCADPIDPYLAYRLVAPGYALWGDMGIYERSTESYAERSLIDNRSTNGGCMNCHTFAAHSPERMMLHLRKEQAGTIIVQGDRAKKVSIKQGPMYAQGVYAAWRPDGRWIAYSVNDIRQHFPLTGNHATEVYDLRGDLVLYDTEQEQITTNKAVFNEQFLYSMPEWGADGRWLYFTRTPKPDTERGTVRYDLCRIGFENGRLADTVETVWAASGEGLSVGRVTAAPNGRWLVAAVGTSGNFTIWHREADLYLIDLQDKEVRPIDQWNSKWAESTPSFSSTGNWVLFSSRRDDHGATTRPYIARFDPTQGTVGKPYLLPQQSEEFYTHRLESFNLPVFITGAVDRRTLLSATD